MKKDTKRKNQNKRKRNKAKNVKKEKNDRRKRNKAKKSKKTKSKTTKNKSKKEKKRSRKQRRKSRKNNKNGRRNGGKQSSKKCARQSGPDDSICMVNIGTAMDYEGNQVYSQCSVQILLCVNKIYFKIANFLKQKKRIESFGKLMGKKGDKKDNFVNSTSYITSACNSSSR